MRSRSRFHPVLHSIAGGALVLMAAAIPAGGQKPERHGVFVRLLEASGMTVEQTATALADAFRGQGLDVLANAPVELDPGFCAYGARVLVLHDGGHALQVLEQGRHAAFAIPLRVAVWEDEAGVHAAAVNPMSLHRTMVVEQGLEATWAELAVRLERVVAGRFPGRVNRTEFGQWRGEGRIGKTMGIMAGGPFPEKVQTLATVPAAGTSVAAVASRITSEMATVPGEWEWGMKPVYSLVLPESGIAIVGVTGGHMETRAYGIVRHGNQKEREKLACPGLDHAAAFPIELVIVSEGDGIRVQAIDAMFRMKMYFEDAGKIAFAKNMGMPGSIADEIRTKLEALLK
jgi:uncharacterized protein (DUF302 family)